MITNNQILDMQSKIVQIGNSKGIRIPAVILKKYKFDKNINIELVDEGLLISPIKEVTRKGWEAEFQKNKTELEKEDLQIEDDLDIDIMDWEWEV